MGSTKVYPNIVDVNSLKAMRICNIAFDAFFEDVKELVADGVRKDVKARVLLASQGPSTGWNAALAHAKTREDCLVSWLETEYPLGYGDNGGDGTFRLLIRAISPNEDSIKDGLPHWSENSIAPFDFVEDLFRMSTSTNPTQPTAPVLQAGAFLPVLKIAHDSILKLLDDTDPKVRVKFLKKVLREALKVFHVHFFPFHLPNSRARGSPYRKPVFNSWANLGGRDTGHDIPLDVLASGSSNPRVPPESIASKRAIADDCNADWSTKLLDLKSLKDVLNKTSLPIDFTLSNPEDDYVRDTYEWVRVHYNGANPIHHLALLVAIMVASTFLPYVFYPGESKHLFRDATSPAAVRDIYNSLDWTTKKKKGLVNQPIFIGMFTAYFIGLYEKNSPLRVLMATKKLGGLGDPWTSKHCTRFFPDRPSFALVHIRLPRL